MELARAIGASKQTISDWLRAGQVSSHYAAKVSRYTGLTKQSLCPSFDWGTDQPVGRKSKRKSAA